MRARSIYLCFCVLILAATVSAASPTLYNHQIQSPSFNEPAIVKAGDSFSVKTFVAPKMQPLAIKLILITGGGKEIDLSVGASIHSEQVDSYLVLMPADAPEGL